MRHTYLRAHSAEPGASIWRFRRPQFFVFLLLALALRAVGAESQTPPSYTPQVLLGTDPVRFTQWLETARPTSVSAEAKIRILASLPAEGEITKLSGSAQRKLAALQEVLRAAERDSVFEVKVVDVPQAAIGLYARAVLLISKAALDLVDADELQALGAHEIAHEYVWAEYERASGLKDHNRLKELELVCDGIAIVTLRQLGRDPFRLIAAIDRLARFNRERLGTALNEGSYPTVAHRRAFAGAVVAWAAGGIR